MFSSVGESEPSAATAAPAATASAPATAAPSVAEVGTQFDACVAEISKAVVGQPDLIEGVLIALVAGGHVLIEGPPGLGKTLLVTTLAHVAGCDSGRVQFTPDLMPADVTGHSVYDLQQKAFTFVPGPVFTNLLLADEINRAPAKTQAALLEAMQERQVTVDGDTRRLPDPFLVLATQNPLEQEGTYPLPEAQLDRFLFKLLADYPDREGERAILNLYVNGTDPRDPVGLGVKQVLNAERVRSLRRAAVGVIVEPAVTDYITRLVRKTRSWPGVEVGASPRAGVSLVLAGRAAAACRGRDFVIPDDIKELAPAVLRHRVRPAPDAELEGVTADALVAAILDAVEAPKGRA
ncbi:AAA family ATPase [Alienimonas californiensis]|uniref:AAA family ATPase n=1 Tax=Alienimonas californiensis TaxID=2527989 RepID=UPI0011AB1CA0|nr:MoxR family ATPase [Alienimonas californiensis]